MQVKIKSMLHSGSAFLMLLIFSMSITPKIYLHDLTANHKDEVATFIQDCHDQHVDQKGFSCDTLNLVATSPFIEADDTIETFTASAYPEHSFEISSRFYTRTFQLPSLRGPPVLNSIS